MSTTHDDIFSEPGTMPFDRILVRDLGPADLDRVVRIDAHAVGRSRREYYTKKLCEVLTDSGIRISLAAECEGELTGFLLGRLYYGEFGLPEPTAIIDSIGVDPAWRGKHVGWALLSQLETNLRGLGIESIQTQVAWNDFGLAKFLAADGFEPAPVLCLQKRLG